MSFPITSPRQFWSSYLFTDGGVADGGVTGAPKSDIQSRGNSKDTGDTPASESAADVGGGSRSKPDNVGGASSSIVFDKQVNYIGASRVMLALLREQPIDGATSDVLHPADNIVVKMCDVKLQLKYVQPMVPSGGVLPGVCRAVKYQIIYFYLTSVLQRKM